MKQELSIPEFSEGTLLCIHSLPTESIILAKVDRIKNGILVASSEGWGFPFMLNSQSCRTYVSPRVL